MWVPYNLLSPLKADATRSAILASEAAKNERAFVVGFILRNPVSRSWESDLLIAEEDREAPLVLDGRHGTVHASVNHAGKLEELIYNVRSSGAIPALADCYQDVVKRLEGLILKSGRGIEIVGWRVVDVEHGARWKCLPSRPSAVAQSAMLQDYPPQYHEMMRLYRESRCATSARWRLICAGTILDAAVMNRDPFRPDEATEEANAADSIRITNDMLIRSNAIIMHPDLKGATVVDFHAVLEPKRQALLKGLLPSGRAELGANPSYHDDLADATVANLADLLARELLVLRLGLNATPRKTSDVVEYESLELSGLS